jgi:transposase
MGKKRRAILALLEQGGMTAREIAEAVACSIYSVYSTAAAAGIALKPAKRGRPAKPLAPKSRTEAEIRADLLRQLENIHSRFYASVTAARREEYGR